MHLAAVVRILFAAATGTPDHPGVCRMAETLITELVGVPVHEHCERGESPRCRLEVAFPDDASGGSEQGP
jgi:hypothetical protein